MRTNGRKCKPQQSLLTPLPSEWFLNNALHTFFFFLLHTAVVKGTAELHVVAAVFPLNAPVADGCGAAALKTPTCFVLFLTPPPQALVLMVSPFAPHLGEECWNLLGNNKGDGVAFAPWIQWKEELCVSDTVTLGVQVRTHVQRFASFVVGGRHWCLLSSMLCVHIFVVVGQGFLCALVYPNRSKWKWNRVRPCG